MRKLLPSILIILYPYCIVFLLFSIFSDSFIMEYLFLNNIFVALLYLGAVWLAALVSAIIIYSRNLTRKKDALELARMSMLIKLIQIPAYAIILIPALICMITIITIGISFLLVLLAAGSILLSGLIGLSAVKRCYEEEILSHTELHFHNTQQFLFYYDVVSSIKVFQRAKIVTEKRAVCFSFDLKPPNS